MPLTDRRALHLLPVVWEKAGSSRMSTRILIGHCAHAAARPPLGRAEGYRDQVLAKLVEIGEIAQQTSADIMIFAGDLFDPKPPKSVSHFLVGQIQSILRG